MHLSPALPDDRQILLELAVATGLFTPGHAEELLGGVLSGWFGGTLPEGHSVVACRRDSDSQVVAWRYVAPDQYAERVWNLWWIGAAPGAYGSGAGGFLLTDAERHAAAHGGRLLVIETSDGAPMARARAFYRKHNYLECGRVPDFYADGEAKIIFARRIDRLTT